MSFLRRLSNRGDGTSVSSSAGNPMKGSKVLTEDRSESNVRAVWVARTMFVSCLFSVATVLGYLAHFYLTAAEQDLAEKQFASISDRALTEASAIAKQKRWATITLASIISEELPDSSVWPYVTVNGFERIVSNLLITAEGTDLGFCPLVKTDQQTEWEAFIYDFYERGRNPPFPNGTAVNSFGKGIFAIDKSLGTSDNRFHDDGSTAKSYGSTNNVLLPLTQIKQGATNMLLFNLHSIPSRSRAIDDLIACSGNQTDLSGINYEYKCGVITSMVKVVKAPTRGPSAIIYQPIYPANDPYNLVGLVTLPIVWDQILENVFASQVNGIDCVLETDLGQKFTYHVTDGVAHPIGEGDLHNTKYDFVHRSIIVTDSDLYTDSSPTFRLSLYPTDEMYKIYSTGNAKVATIGVVSVILFTSLLFFLYDFFVRREDLAKDELLTAKRNFIRFISHEVRTPLNSVSMGLSVLLDEMAVSLGHASADQLRAISNEQLPDGGEKGSTQQWFDLTDEVLQNSQSAVDVLSDLLNYDKIESKSLILELSVIPFWDLLEKTVAEFKLPACKKELDVQLSYEDCMVSMNSDVESTDCALPPKSMTHHNVIGDETKLVQVLRNLISNSIKFTEARGSLKIKVCRLDAEAQSKKRCSKTFQLATGDSVNVEQVGALQVNVTDTGAGMSPDDLSDLFQMGVQFNAINLQGGKGSGFGLWISKGIVELHEGSLKATSPGCGLGSTFTLTLPLYVSPYMEERGTKETTETLLVVPSETKKLLVVDDSLSNRKLLGRLLTNAGHTCDYAEHGLQAVEMVRENLASSQPSYDTILMDFEMPVMNGPTAAKAMRLAGVKVHIVGVTGNLLPEDVAHFEACGANKVMGKPFRMAILEKAWLEHEVLLHDHCSEDTTVWI